MKPLPRGIAPDLLVSQVKSTMPYLFQTEAGSSPLDRFPGARTVKSYPGKELTHFEYFKLCLSSHYLSCATPVPTDVDNQIRLKLWPAKLPLEAALEMADLVLESRKWDFTLVSARHTFGASGTAWEKEPLLGHLGEWFTVSCAAYCALSQYRDVNTADSPAGKKRAEVFAAIADEVNRHSEIFGSLWKAGDGVACLKTAANIAHNFGDLDRVMDMWSLSVGDPLRLQFYKLSAQPFDADRKLRYLGRLWVAGELYKSPIDPPSETSSLALENHRHFALRKPRCLRESVTILIPTAPFFDAWGGRVAAQFRDAAGKPTEKTFEILETLAAGWVRQPGTVAYGRGLRGILDAHSDLHSHDSIRELLKDRKLREVLETPRERFEKKWGDAAIRLMDDIPSRAE